ncbi:M23 family metallopeptidase [Mastigocoleus sp. MO_188.B34]|uniref:M23 family metallopeptidase n=1 Tax=Mastigocoleus sp. MO_188.B34 TaxID=3036635 RepID=UPI002605E3E8|nr:M23 family metallopeptidase [Mastigocoleus sp. MO_188.B34]MDJ0694314.1 M23 family metallopeptidase [Mastigocoleus sp. MO_188.B34]
MTQRHNSADKKLHKPSQESQNVNQDVNMKRLVTTVPARGLCWLGSFSLLSSGLVFAQTESSIDNIVPTVISSQPTSQKTQSQLQVGLSQQRASLRERLRKAKASNAKPVSKIQLQKKSGASALGARQGKPKVKVTASNSANNPVIIKTRESKNQKSQPQVSASQKKPKATNLNPSVAPRTTKKITNSTASHAVRNSVLKTRDYNNAYIDPTDYNPQVNSKYKAPSSVVLKERRTGCEAVLSRSRKLASNYCQQLVKIAGNSKSKNPRKPVPSWMKKGQTLNLGNISSIRRSGKGLRKNRSSASRRFSQRLARVNLNAKRVRNTANNILNPNRFIPSPNNFLPSGQNTIVSSSPIAPSGGALPLPLTALKQAPRATTLAYNIPLASVLPRIGYRPAIAYSGHGMAFPLSIPARISSMFGWRQHPIAGVQRFHSGIDLAAAMGTPIIAVESGRVETADWLGGYGLTAILKHNDRQKTLYGHMSEILVQPGQVVEKGTVIGRVGSTGNSTGPHLHFEVRQRTSSGWVAVDPGMELNSSLAQLTRSLQTAQVYQPEK